MTITETKTYRKFVVEHQPPRWLATRLHVTISGGTRAELLERVDHWHLIHRHPDVEPWVTHLRATRKACGMSQKAMAELVGISISSYHHVERGIAGSRSILATGLVIAQLAEKSLAWAEVHRALRDTEEG